MHLSSAGCRLLACWSFRDTSCSGDGTRVKEERCVDKKKISLINKCSVEPTAAAPSLNTITLKYWHHLLIWVKLLSDDVLWKLMTGFSNVWKVPFHFLSIPERVRERKTSLLENKISIAACLVVSFHVPTLKHEAEQQLLTRKQLISAPSGNKQLLPAYELLFNFMFQCQKIRARSSSSCDRTVTHNNAVEHCFWS